MRHLPIWHVTQQALLAGESPFWLEGFYCGHPLLFTQEVPLFYPLTVPLLATGARVHRLADLFSLFHFWLAGFLAFLFLRDVRSDVFSSLFGGIAWMLSARLLQTALWPNAVAASALVPLVLLALLRIGRGQRRSGVLFVAVSGGLALLTARPQVLLSAAPLVAILVAATIVLAARKGEAVRDLLLGGALALLLGAPSLVPSALLYPETSRAGGSRGCRPRPVSAHVRGRHRPGFPARRRAHPVARGGRLPGRPGRPPVLGGIGLAWKRDSTFPALCSSRSSRAGYSVSCSRSGIAALTRSSTTSLSCAGSDRPYASSFRGLLRSRSAPPSFSGGFSSGCAAPGSSRSRPSRSSPPTSSFTRAGPRRPHPPTSTRSGRGSPESSRKSSPRTNPDSREFWSLTEAISFWLHDDASQLAACGRPRAAHRGNGHAMGTRVGERRRAAPRPHGDGLRDPEPGGAARRRGPRRRECPATLRSLNPRSRSACRPGVRRGASPCTGRPGGNRGSRGSGGRGGARSRPGPAADGGTRRGEAGGGGFNRAARARIGPAGLEGPVADRPPRGLLLERYSRLPQRFRARLERHVERNARTDSARRRRFPRRSPSTRDAPRALRILAARTVRGSGPCRRGPARPGAGGHAPSGGRSGRRRDPRGLFDAGATSSTRPAGRGGLCREFAADGARFTEEELTRALRAHGKRLHALPAGDRYGGARGEAGFWAAFLNRVRSLLDGGVLSPAGFERLARHFRNASAWAVYDDVVPTLEELSRREKKLAVGLELGLVSTEAPRRARARPRSSPSSRVRASRTSEAGSRDLLRTCRRLEVPPAEALHVGRFGGRGPRRSARRGICPGLLLDRADAHPGIADRIRSLAEIPALGRRARVTAIDDPTADLRASVEEPPTAPEGDPPPGARSAAAERAVTLARAGAAAAAARPPPNPREPLCYPAPDLKLPSGLFRTKSLDALVAETEQPNQQLRRALGPGNLIALGIGAIIGAGIFATIGTAAAGDAAPAGRRAGARCSRSSLTAVVCGFTALCYAEFASMVPVSGSAYTYSYATLGELVAWIIGWDLIIEYAIGNVAVAISWAQLLQHPARGPRDPLPAVADRSTSGPRTPRCRTSSRARRTSSASRSSSTCSPSRSSRAHHGRAGLGHQGVRAASTSGWSAIKLVVLGFFVVVSFTLSSKPENWTPFAPNGWHGRRGGRGHRLLRLHRLRRGLDDGRGGAQPAARHADRHHRLARHLHGHLRRRRRGLHGHDPVHRARSRRSRPSRPSR